MIALAATSSLYAQGVKDIRFNEVLVKNSSSVVNKWGERGGWIEFTNIGFSTTDLGGCHLVKVSPSGEEKHIIPKGLNTTYIAPLNYILFHFGAAESATMSANFCLDDATEIRLFDSSGKNLIDKVIIDQNLVSEDIALGRPLVDRGSLAGRVNESDIASRVVTLEKTAKMTPGYSNFPPPAESRSEQFRRVDSTGAGMAVIAMSVVFLALLCLFGVFSQVGSFMHGIARKKEAKANAALSPEEATTHHASSTIDSLNGETLAAIGFALKLYNDELNESEARVLTINRTVKAYSPWSSKIYGLTQAPERRK